MNPIKTIPINPWQCKGYILTRPFLREIEHIDGRLDDEEGELLVHAAHDVLINKAGDGAVVEIGSYNGKTTILLGNIIKRLEKTATPLYAIDMFEEPAGFPDAFPEEKPSTYTRFMYNIHRAGLNDIIRPVKGRPFQLTDWNVPVSFLVINGVRDYDNLARDFLPLENRIIPGGYIAFHDYSLNFPGVKVFVDELLLSGQYRIVSSTKAMMIIEKHAAEYDEDEAEEKAGDGSHSRLQQLLPPLNLPVLKSRAPGVPGPGESIPPGNRGFPRGYRKNRQLILFCLFAIILAGVMTFLYLKSRAGYYRIQGELRAEQLGWSKEKEYYQKEFGPPGGLDFKISAFKRKYPQFGTIVTKAYNEARKNNLSPYIVMSIIHVLSNFNPNAKSSVAHGLMMINLQVWRDFFRIDDKRIYEIGYNISLGCKILRHYLDKTGGDMSRALFLYNNGYLYNNEKFVPKVLGSIFAHPVAPVNSGNPSTEGVLKRNEF